jgi:hypothetical protein
MKLTLIRQNHRGTLASYRGIDALRAFELYRHIYRTFVAAHSVRTGVSQLLEYAEHVPRIRRQTRNRYSVIYHGCQVLPDALALCMHAVFEVKAAQGNQRFQMIFTSGGGSVQNTQEPPFGRNTVTQVLFNTA